MRRIVTALILALATLPLAPAPAAADATKCTGFPWSDVRTCLRVYGQGTYVQGVELWHDHPGRMCGIRAEAFFPNEGERFDRSFNECRDNHVATYIAIGRDYGRPTTLCGSMDHDGLNEGAACTDVHA